MTALALAVAASGCGGASTSSSKLVSIGAGLKGPKGLHATVYARGLTHVSALTFDGSLRLWATTSGASTHGSDGVFLIAHAGATPEKVVSIKGPLGLVWSRDRLVVSSLGRVTSFGDLAGKRFGSRTTILRGPPGGGENNNVIRAPNGRLVMGVSASCDHCVPNTKWSGAVVSFRPDGGGLRLVATRIRAPFGLVYYPGTHDLYASMNQRDDLGAKTPGDWLGLVRQGQNWGFPGCYGQTTGACASRPKPVAVLDPHAAAGGVAILVDELGFRSSAVVAEWQLAKVVRVDLPSGKAAPFLTGVQNPLPVITTRDESLLVGDWATGTIYRIASG